MNPKIILAFLSGLWMLFLGIPDRTLHAAPLPHDSLRASRQSARVLRGQGKFEEAMAQYESAYQASVEAYGAQDTFSARVQMDIGLVHFLSGTYEEGLTSCRSALANFRLADGVRAKDTMICFFRIGILLRALGDLHRAEDFMLASLDVAETEDFGNAIHRGKCHNALGNITLRKEKYDLARGHFRKALAILTPILGEGSVHRGSMFMNLGVVYMHTDSLDKSVASHEKSLEIFMEKMPPNHPSIGNCYLNLGEAHLAKGNMEEAERWMERARVFWEKNLPAGHASHIDVQRNLAEWFRKKGNGKLALEHCQAALELLAPGFDGSDWREDPSPDSCRYNEELLEVWRAKAGVLAMLHKEQAEEYNLEEIFELYGKISTLVDQMRQGFRRESSQLFLSGRSLPVFEEAIALAWENEEAAETAFKFAEKSKAVLLYGAVKGREAKNFAGVPQGLLKRESELKEELLRLNQEIDGFELEGEEKRAEEYQGLLRERLAMQAGYEALMDTFEREHPDYFELKYAHEVLSVAEVQGQLQGRDASLIAYFQGDQHLYGWAISPSAIQFRRLASRTEVNRLCDSLLDRTIARKPLGHLPHEAYQLLLAPLLEGLSPSQSLIFVRDGKLEYLPFAMLQTQAEDGSERYLVQQYALSYAPSATIHFREALPSTAESGYLGYALGFPGGLTISEALRDQSLSALPHTREEVEAGAKLFRGEGRFDEKATETNFYREAPGHSILHLATHTLIDDRNPLYSRLLLQGEGDSDGYLHTYELFGMQLDAELVVLSACNTGKGLLQRGEGMMSLSRGFAYAGCPSILMTHWTVSDRQNAQLMEDFFEGLADGLPKDVALQQAQVDYLAEADEITGHPWFWAAPGLIGSEKPLQAGNSGSGDGLWLLLALGMLAAGIWWWRKAAA